MSFNFLRLHAKSGIKPKASVIFYPPLKKPLQSGFTLVELLIVITIIALLSALVAPRLINHLSASKGKTTRAQIGMLTTALDNFRLDNGRYPTQQEGLAALQEQPEGLSNWLGPYLRKKRMPKDSWNFDFHYQIPPTHGGLDFDLFSLGADNAPGGEDENSDIGNWE